MSPTKTRRHGATPGCPACGHVPNNTKTPRGVGHPTACLKRMRELIEIDEGTRDRVERAYQRKKKREDTAGSIRASHDGRTGPSQNPSATGRELHGPGHITKPQKEMQLQMMKLVAGDIDAVEIYSPPRVTKSAKRWGLEGGWSPDFTTKDSDGKTWDFSKSKMRKRAIEKINKDKPLLTVGSPMGTDWSTMANLNWQKKTAEDRTKRMHEARKHLRSCVKTYKHQISEGRYYVHEHPMNAGSWHEPEMRALINQERNTPTRLDQCQYGLWIEDKEGRSLAKIPTKFLTNSPCTAQQMARRCLGKQTHANGRHASLADGGTKKAQVYPEALCDAPCFGTKEQTEQERKG